MAKSIHNLSVRELAGHMKQRGVSRDHPLLFSFDVDRTLVNRKLGSHALSQGVIDMFRAAREASRYRLALNTARDATTCRPIMIATGHTAPCIFLAGRVWIMADRSSFEAAAALPRSFLDQCWQMFERGDIGFLDVKHRGGNCFFTDGRRNLHELYGHKKPIDWGEGLLVPIYDLTTEADCRSIYRSLTILRMELPVLNAGDCAVLFEPHAMGAEGLADFTARFLSTFPGSGLEVHLKKSRVELRQQIASLQFISDSRTVNKGSGLKKLAAELDIPPVNIFHFGDSSQGVDDDSSINDMLPEAQLVAVGEFDTSIENENLGCDGPERDGVPRAVAAILSTLN